MYQIRYTVLKKNYGSLNFRGYDFKQKQYCDIIEYGTCISA